MKFGRWYNPRTDRKLAAVRITHYLDREAVARLLIAGTQPGAAAELDELSVARIIKIVRGELKANGTSRSDWWRDDYLDEYAAGVSADDVWDWALKQVSKLQEC